MTSFNNDKTLITFWGTRGSVSTPGRITEKYGGNTPCVSLSHRGTTVILDAGTGIRNLGLELVQGEDTQAHPLSLHLFLSHTHWDHIQGLPFFQPAYLESTHLTIYGSPKKERFLGAVLKGQMDYDYFPVDMSSLTAEIHIQEISEEIIQLGPIKVDWQEQVYHPGGSVRYRFHIKGKKIVYATDIELDQLFCETDTDEKRESLCREYLEFIDKADLLIADGMYTGDEYPNKRGWGHSSIPVLIEIACRARVRQLAVFHHDPQHSDTFLDDLWVKNRPKYVSGSHHMVLFWAREGLTLSV